MKIADSVIEQWDNLSEEGKVIGNLWSVFLNADSAKDTTASGQALALAMLARSADRIANALERIADNSTAQRFER